MTYAGLKGEWSSGALHIQSATDGRDVVVIGGPTTGLKAIPAGYVTVVTTSATLGVTNIGRTIIADASTTVTFTLPYSNSTCVHAKYKIVNGASSGSAAVIVLTAVTTDVFAGCGWSSTAVPYQLTNTAATANPGDMVELTAGGSTTGIWWVTGLVGTWVSTT